ncbi:hypothetical protein BDA96_04G258400 [Sorghum bicolor]|uniref:Uncharacterized protein n=1 Tax=Sorghum bicolor TaxID=4558 RepID=A0A921ULP0_SORBI|nr:hypothetical protein BDA96_04G258400 [Sorghum bicolor]
MYHVFPRSLLQAKGWKSHLMSRKMQHFILSMIPVIIFIPILFPEKSGTSPVSEMV